MHEIRIFWMHDDIESFERKNGKATSRIMVHVLMQLQQQGSDVLHAKQIPSKTVSPHLVHRIEASCTVV